MTKLELQNNTEHQQIKESTRDVTNVTRLRNRFGDRYKILCGVDPFPNLDRLKWEIPDGENGVPD